MTMRRNTEEDFYKNIIKTESCWIWTGPMSQTYGTFGMDNTIAKAHRWSFKFRYGRWPQKGMDIDHLCRNRICVNPEHLEEVTRKVNTTRGVGPTAINFAKTHCKRGHEFTQENTYIRKASATASAGWRNCKKCREILRKKVFI